MPCSRTSLARAVACKNLPIVWPPQTLLLTFAMPICCVCIGAFRYSADDGPLANLAQTGLHYRFRTPSGADSAESSGSLPTIGSRPVELELKAHRPLEVGVWSVSGTFVRNKKTIGMYEKKFLVVGESQKVISLEDIAKVYKVEKLCSSDPRHTGTCGGIASCKAEKWSTLYAHENAVSSYGAA